MANTDNIHIDNTDTLRDQLAELYARVAEYRAAANAAEKARATAHEASLQVVALLESAERRHTEKAQQRAETIPSGGKSRAEQLRERLLADLGSDEADSASAAALPRRDQTRAEQLRARVAAPDLDDSARAIALRERLSLVPDPKSSVNGSGHGKARTGRSRGRPSSQK